MVLDGFERQGMCRRRALRHNFIGMPERALLRLLKTFLLRGHVTGLKLMECQ